MSENWAKPLRLHEVGRGAITVKLAPDEAERAAVAKRLGLKGLLSLTADLTVKPWLDGAEISGRFDAVVEQICGVSLDPFDEALRGEIYARVVPAGSEHAPTPDVGEMEMDLESDDPPDVLAGDAIDLADYVVEHLALEVDPFPRKPGATFDYQPVEADESPFAALKKLTEPKP